MNKHQQGIGRDFYFNVTDSTGHSRTDHARLWGTVEQFLSARRAQYAKEGFTITPASEAEYRAQHWGKAA